AATDREIWTVRDFGGRLLTRDIRDPKQMAQLGNPAGLGPCPGSNSVFCDGFESGGTAVWTLASQGRDVSDYIWRGDKLLGAAYVTGGGARHFALDHLGTVRLVVSDVDPQVLAQPNYYPFGREVTTTTQIEEPMKFTGHERDAFDTLPVGDDVDYMHARFRSPVTGRFLSVDRLGGRATVPQSWNAYAYVLGNPIRYVDPNGDEPVTATLTAVRTTASALPLPPPVLVAATGF